MESILNILKAVTGILLILGVLFSLTKSWVLLPVNINANAAGLTDLEQKHDKEMAESERRGREYVDLKLDPINATLQRIDDRFYKFELKNERQQKAILDALKASVHPVGAHVN